MSIPQTFIQELLARTDIVEVVGKYVQLKKGGVNLMGLCPFHGEKSPSFSVSPTKQFFHCFGCGKHGNAIGFLMEHTGIGFVEAVKDLAQSVGLQVPEEESSPQERARAAQERSRQLSLTETLEKAAAAFRDQLKKSPRAIEYFKGRGLSGQIAKQFGLGYAPPGWRFLSTVFPDYQDPLLQEAGLVIVPDQGHDAESAPESKDGKRYDRFRDRVMFPIRNVKGEYIGFGGRVLDKGEPKYLNSPETPVFSKGHELYGLFEARTAIRQNGFVLVTEGYMDVVALAQLGFGNAVATLGTACTADHVRKLFRFSDAVVFSFDGDAAGRRAARKALEAALPWATDTRSIRFLFLPAEHDPDSFVRTHGSEAFAQAIKEAMPLSIFVLEAAAQDCDLATAEGRARMASHAEPLWNLMPDGTLKRQILGELADRVGIDARELAQLWQTSSKRRMGVKAQRPNFTEADNSESSRLAEMTGERASTRKKTMARGDSHWNESPQGRRSPPYGKPASRRSLRGLLGRADRVARIVLSTPEAWDWLSADDHFLLGHEAEPHGPLFAWLETQWHEHGPQPWAALREALRGQAFETFALELQASGVALERPPEDDNPESSGPPTEKELRRELRELLRRMHIERLKERETDLIQQASHDPEALERYREVQQLRKTLESGN